MIENFKINILDSGAKVWPRTNLAGVVVGMSSGNEAANGVPAGYGVGFGASIRVSNLQAVPRFVHIVQNVTNGNPGLEFVNGEKRNVIIDHKTVTYPLNDAFSDSEAPYYRSESEYHIGFNSMTVSGQDTPSFAHPDRDDLVAQERLIKMDVLFQARLHLVVQYTDKSMWSLAYSDWRVNFNRL